MNHQVRSQTSQPLVVERALRVCRRDGSKGEWVTQIFVRDETDGHVEKTIVPVILTLPTLKTSWWQVTKIALAVATCIGLVYLLTAQ